MNDFDDRIGRALAADTSDVDASDELGDTLIARGRARRRRKTAIVGAMSTGVALLAGVAIVNIVQRDEPGAIATDPGTTVDTTQAVAPTPPVTGTSMPAFTVPSSSAGTTTVPTSTEPPTTTATTTATTTTPTTTPAIATSTTVPATASERPIGVEPIIASSLLTIDGVGIEFGVTGQVPVRSNGFFVGVGDIPSSDSSFELWSPSGRAAHFDITGCLDQCSVNERLAYDGSAAWLVIERRDDSDDTRGVLSSSLVRADLRTGEISPVLESERAWSIMNVATVDDGRVLAVSIGPTFLDRRVARLHDVGATTPSILAEVELAEDLIVSVVLDTDGTRMAYTTAAPISGSSQVAATRFADGATSTLDVLGVGPFFPLAVGWAGDLVLLRDGWEDWGFWLVDPAGELPGALDTLGAADAYDTESACLAGDDAVVRSTWQIPYAEGDLETGTMVLVRAGGIETADFGVDVVSAAIACLADGHVALATFTRTDNRAYDEPRQLTIAALGGSGAATTRVLAEGAYRIIHP